MSTGQAGCCREAEGAPAVPTMSPPEPPLQHQVNLCPISLQVGMELAFLASSICMDPLLAPRELLETEGGSVAPADGPPADVNAQRADPPDAEGTASLVEDIPLASGVAPSERGECTLGGESEDHSESRPLPSGISANLAHRGSALHICFPRDSLDFGSNTTWKRVLSAYGLGTTPTARIVEQLLAQALHSTEQATLILQQDEMPTYGSRLQELLESDSSVNLLYAPTTEESASAAPRTPGRRTSSPQSDISPAWDSSTAFRSGLSSSMSACAQPGEEHRPASLQATWQQQQSDGQSFIQPSGVVGPQSGHPQAAILSREAQELVDAFETVERTRTLVETEAETRSDAVQCGGSLLSPARAPHLPALTRARGRTGLLLGRSHISERLEASLSLSAPPPSGSRRPSEHETASAMWEPHTEESHEGGAQALRDTVADCNMSGEPNSRGSEDDRSYGTTRGRQRSESAGCGACDTSFAGTSHSPQRASISLSFRSRVGGLVLQGRPVPHGRGEWPESSSRNRGVTQAAPQDLESMARGSGLSTHFPRASCAVGSVHEGQEEQAPLPALLESGLPSALDSHREETRLAGAFQLGTRQDRTSDEPTDEAWLRPHPWAPWRIEEPTDYSRWEQQLPLNVQLGAHQFALPHFVAPQGNVVGASIRNLNLCHSVAPQVEHATSYSARVTGHGLQQQEQPLYDPRPQPPARESNERCVSRRTLTATTGNRRRSHNPNEHSMRLVEYAVWDIEDQRCLEPQPRMCSSLVPQPRRPPDTEPNQRAEHQGLLYHNEALRGDIASQFTEAHPIGSSPIISMWLSLTDECSLLESMEVKIVAWGHSAQAAFPLIAFPSQPPLRAVEPSDSPLQPLAASHVQGQCVCPIGMGTEVTLITLAPSVISDSFLRPGRAPRQPPEPSQDGPGYPEPLTQESNIAAPDFTARRTTPSNSFLEVERDYASSTRRYRGGSLANSGAQGALGLYGASGSGENTSAYEPALAQSQMCGSSPQRQISSLSRTDAQRTEAGQPLQQHLVEQWMRKSEAHMEGLERLMQRLLFILESVEARELGLN
ncbi:hypothetical protein cyc_05915 [Cyclospora cayetanensis]|uniref:Uncharacterized protein n=1 Tax=Cyclospora cayetanensis TaxID=88456 RepID=A0A1D3CWL7_9EIME|nr:hypothetical protein cyc_05915 [Cyclospora cayetanensis]